MVMDRPRIGFDQIDRQSSFSVRHVASSTGETVAETALEPTNQVSHEIIGHERREGELQISAVGRKTLGLQPVDVFDDGPEKTFCLWLVLKRQSVLSHVSRSSIECFSNGLYARNGWIWWTIRRQHASHN